MKGIHMRVGLLFPVFSEHPSCIGTNSIIIISLLVHTSAANLQVLKFSTRNTASVWIVETICQSVLYLKLIQVSCRCLVQEIDCDRDRDRDR